MTSSRTDRVSLSGGIAFVLLGCLLGLDQLDLISLSGGLAAAAICAAAGSTLASAGLSAPLEPGDPVDRRPRADSEAEERDGRRLYRDPEKGMVGGVIAGLAARFGWDVRLLRVLVAVGVIVSGGLVLAAYVFAWAVIPVAAGDGRPGRPRRAIPGGRRGWQLGLGVGLLTLSALLIFRELGIWLSDAFVWPLVLAAAGAALLWAQTRRTSAIADERGDTGFGADRRPFGATPAAAAEGGSRLLDLYRGGFGIALVVGAALLFLTQNNALGAARDAAFTSIVAIFALALILAPFIWRLGRNLTDERTERIRSQERAEMAAHLHDSVLQTLTLMQKRSDDPREVAALARRQERELRGWLAADPRAAGVGGFAAAIESAAEEVEDAYRVKIEVVAVGDCELDQLAAAVVGAAREALTNAAKFAGSEGPIAVYAEVGEGTIEVYVRDRGPGFDPDQAPVDRRGVRDSIVGRMRRHGGTATIASVPGAGTEVQLRVERKAE